MKPPRPEKLAFLQPVFSNREPGLLAAVLLVGVALRLVAFSRSAVEHFDEGVYASNIYFGPPDYAYPQQRFFAPPLLPALIEAGMIAGLPPNVAALLPSFLAGCATIVAVWWLSRFWFGPDVGLSAAALVALSDFHVMFSAAALTDVLLGLWLVLAVDAITRSLANADFRWAIGAGIYTGLAWWTKYNGWLPLAIEGATLPLLWLMLRPPRKQLTDWLGCFAVTALVALLAWAPYYHWLELHGGYAPIAANHARYFVGLHGWLDAASRQIANQYSLETVQSVVGVALALGLSSLLRRQSVWERVWRGGLSLCAGLVALFWTSAAVAGVGALIGIVRVLAACRRVKQMDVEWRRRLAGVIVLLVWWGGLLAATPCYTPYPRLALPWLMASWLGLSLNCADFLLHDERAAKSGSWLLRHKAAIAITVLVGIVLVSAVFLPRDDHFVQSFDRRGMLRIAQQIKRQNSTQPRVIYLYGEPALFFQLRAAGEELVAPVQDVPSQSASVDGRPIATLLIIGPHARTDPQFQRQWTDAENQWQLLETLDYTPSVLVWLDLHDPRRAAQQPIDHSIQLFKLRD